MTFDFRDLFIFEMANNHQGRVDHGVRIIREMGKIAKDRGIRAAIKFQFRELSTFIHPEHTRNKTTNKHIKRFLDTHLLVSEFKYLVDEVRKNDLITMATPFDEASLDLITDLGIEVVKIGSCSAQDWPLIEEIAGLGKPVVFSTGGLTMREIDDVSSYFDNRSVHHAIMHCVALYPTPAEHFQLNQISALCRRYPNKVIGFSSHEGKWQTSPITLAYALGARIFERHVGIEEKKVAEYGTPAAGIILNAYSADPVDVRGWLDDYAMAKTLCGATERPESTPEEQAALLDLKRGVYAKTSFDPGNIMDTDLIYFAMPCLPDQLTAGEWRRFITTNVSLARDEPVMRARVTIEPDPIQQILSTATHTIKGMLAEAKIALPPDFKLEFSHHHGLVRFPGVGATIIEVVNQEYCKKLIILTPGQRHPAHYHNRKDETFQVLSGRLYISVDGMAILRQPGEVIHIRHLQTHEFWSETGAIVEEISTTHQNDDSYYSDPLIKALKREERKTIVEGWGRFR